MVRYLINHPIGVILSFIIFIVFGFAAMRKIPVSLLPNIDVPEVVIHINYPNNSASSIENNITSPIREGLISINNLDKIESQSTNHSATIFLRFKYGSRMDLAYVNINERIDRLLSILPKDLARPQVFRINTSDIPIVRLQIFPKTESDFIETSELVERVIKKRLEQLNGVSLVDINGKRSDMISIEPRTLALRAAGLDEQSLAKAIQDANGDLGSLSVKDGHYRFFVKLNNSLKSVDQIAAIPIHLSNGSIISIDKLASIKNDIEKPIGYHLYEGKEGLVVTVHKQSEARMNELMPQIIKTVEAFKKDYPNVRFALTQDQTYLLNSGIENLIQDLIYGGILCVILLFLFLGNYASPILMSISIPLSLLLTFIFFYLFNISFNIISLSGLALGIGMLVDNSIVVLDNITRKRREGFSMADSCVNGTNEVMVPVVSQVLSTVIIYAPLIYLSGLAGALIYDQAIALTISLGVSLVVAFCLNPLLYKLFLKTNPENLKNNTILFSFILKWYHRMIDYIFQRKLTFFIITIAFIPLGLLLILIVPLSTLPQIRETESLVKIDWNQSIDASENKIRMLNLTQLLDKRVKEWESDVGIKDFFLQHKDNSIQNAELYYKCISEEGKRQIDFEIDKWLKQNYPKAKYEIQNAPNAFTQLFVDNEPFFEARFRPLHANSENKLKENYKNLLSTMPKLPWIKGIGFAEEQNVEMEIQNQKISLYKIDRNLLREELEKLFGSYTISSIKRFSEEKDIKFKTSNESLSSKLNLLINSKDGEQYPLKSFINYSFGSERRFITADKSGEYQSVFLNKNDWVDPVELQKEINRIAIDNDFSVDYHGEYFYNKELTGELIVVFIISIMLLYVLLAVQFENLVHPLIVMFTIPFGIGGAMLVLWISGSNLDIMAAIGFVVVLGIIVDDPTLKVETINRLRKEYKATGMVNEREILIKALYQAGEICLKPLLMVSLTTSLALIPVLFSGGIGNDLQRPLIYVIIGGLTLGTFLTLWFTPLAYWFLTKKE